MDLQESSLKLIGQLEHDLINVKSQQLQTVGRTDPKYRKTFFLNESKDIVS